MTATSNSGGSAHKPESPALSLVERALKESLHSPTFLDVKFFVFSRRSYGEDGAVRVDRPQHVLAISSILKRTDYFDKLLSGGFSESANGKVPIDAEYPEEKAPYTDDYDYESDSDLEDEEPEPFEEEEAGDGADPPSSHKEGKKRASPRNKTTRLSHGLFLDQCQQIIVKDVAYHTWRAFMFYLYFGKVNFLPLKSEDGHARTEELERALGDPDAVPPCSPKSMYRLAEKYGINDLQDLAFKAIRARLTSKNIVQEVFSRFTSRYDKIRDEEINFLRSHYTDVSDTLTSVTERIVQGEFPHAGEVLKTLLDAKMGANGSQASDTPWYKSTRPSTSKPNPKRSPTNPPSRGNVAPPLFRTNYQTLFSQTQGHQPSASTNSIPTNSTWLPPTNSLNSMHHNNLDDSD